MSHQNPLNQNSCYKQPGRNFDLQFIYTPIVEETDFLKSSLIISNFFSTGSRKFTLKMNKISAKLKYEKTSNLVET